TGRPSLRRDGHAPVAQPLPTPPPSWRTSQPGWRTKGAKISPITSEKSPNREGVSANRRGGLRVRLRSVVGGAVGGAGLGQVRPYLSPNAAIDSSLISGEQSKPWPSIIQGITMMSVTRSEDHTSELH